MSLRNNFNVTNPILPLFTSKFTLYNNSAGCDSCIIKVKSYYNGRESVVAKAEFRIVYNDKARTFGK